MNELARILGGLSDEERRDRGLVSTPFEIHQQPEMWEESFALVSERATELKAFLAAAGVAPGAAGTLYLLGAGTSEYVGNAVADTLRSRLRVGAVSLPTTTFVTAPLDWIAPGRAYLFVHFARSGDSPESLASYELARQLAPESHHLVITCNREGSLAKESRRDNRTLVVCLPDRTNDRSLVMTSSYSSMALAAITLSRLDAIESFRPEVHRAADAARRLLDEGATAVEGFAALAPARLQFLGTGNLYGCMQECRLKTLEMTGGRILANADTYLGLRHGPQVFVNEDCAVVASLSSDPHRRAYEIDLLKELRAKRQGKETLLICNRLEEAGGLEARFAVELSPGETAVSNDLRVVTDVVVGQLLGLFASMRLGLKPDSPSESGIIHRVVSGVSIYPFTPPAGRAQA